MKVIEESNVLRLSRDGNRSKGLHLSNVIQDLAIRMKILDAKYDTGPMEEYSSDSEVVHVGLAWEDYLIRTQPDYADVDYHPGELVYQGIAMTPDVIKLITEDLDDIGVVDGSLLVIEIKSTAKSSRDFLQSLRLRAKKTLKYLWQVESYRHAVNMLYPENACYVSKLDVLFVMGDYSRDFDSSPTARTHRRVFRLHHTPEELEDTWNMIANHAECMRKEGKLGE